MVDESKNEGEGAAIDYSLVEGQERKLETTLQFKLETYQRMMRDGMRVLSASEFAVAMQIIDRTVGWGQYSATVTAGAMLNGGGAYSGMSMSRATLFRSLSSLEVKGLIKRRITANGFMRLSINPGWTPDMINLPKHLQGKPEGSQFETGEGSQAETTPSHDETTPSQIETLYTGNQNTDNQITDTAAPDGGGDLGFQNPIPEKKKKGPSPQSPPSKIVKSKINAAVEANTAARKAKINPTRGRTDVAAGIEATWRQALIETFPGVSHVPWDVRLKHNVKQKAKDWKAGSQITFDELADWAVRNWSRIITKQFGWMKRKAPPVQPDIRFFLYFAPKFMEAWADREFQQWLNSKERTELEKLMAKGMTREEAENQIAQDRAEARMHERNRESEAKASQKLREARMVREQAKRIAEVHVPSRRNRPKTDLKVTGETGHADILEIPLAKNNPFDVQY